MPLEGDLEEIRVRVYNEADYTAVVALWEEVFDRDPPWNKPHDLIKVKQSVQPELFLVCEQDGQIVGTTMAGFDGVRGWVHKVAASPGRRRQGIAQALMREAERRLKKMGCVKLNLQVRADNASAVEFYKSLGYLSEERISLGKRLVD